MKSLLLPIAAIVVTGVVHAASDFDIYHGLAQNNPDLYDGMVEVASAVQPGIGESSVDRFERVDTPEADIFDGDWFDLRNEEIYGSF